jgi:hypothetical protein
MLNEIERDPELKKLITTLHEKDERALPALLIAAGAWLASPAGATTVGLVGGAVAGWLAVD